MAVIKKSEMEKLNDAQKVAKIAELERAILEMYGEGRRDKVKPLKKAIASLKTPRPKKASAGKAPASAVGAKSVPTQHAPAQHAPVAKQSAPVQHAPAPSAAARPVVPAQKPAHRASASEARPQVHMQSAEARKPSVSHAQAAQSHGTSGAKSPAKRN